MSRPVPKEPRKRVMEAGCLSLPFFWFLFGFLNWLGNCIGIEALYQKHAL